MATSWKREGERERERERERETKGKVVFKLCQYLVAPPFALLTALIRAGIDCTNLWQSAGVIRSQASLHTCQSCCSLESRRSTSCCFCFRIAHKFSIGFRSGDCAGQVKTTYWLVFNHSFVRFAVCFGSLSCTKTACWSPNKSCMLGLI